ncbi:hypothetical protein GCM10023165_52820 [Variovorax defluvii]|uniref:Uncharacterized protein n=1 Tax=Variovorax defluvii TaxID=913761 RepID=A0ABP8IGI5_9BURK
MQPKTSAALQHIAFTIGAPDADRPPVLLDCTLGAPAFEFLMKFQCETEDALGIHLSTGQALEALLGAYASLRFATDGDPEWSFDEAYDRALNEAVKNGTATRCL